MNFKVQYVGALVQKLWSQFLKWSICRNSQSTPTIVSNIRIYGDWLEYVAECSFLWILTHFGHQFDLHLPCFRGRMTV